LAKENALLAVQKDPNEPLARLLASFTATFEKDFGEATRQAEAALALNPNAAEAYACLANIKTFLGEPREARLIDTHFHYSLAPVPCPTAIYAAYSPRVL